MVPVVLHTANIATARALRPPNRMAHSLRGDDLPLNARQQPLRFGQGQTQVGDIDKIIGPSDLHDVRAWPLALSPDLHQPQHPSHASTLGQRTNAKITNWPLHPQTCDSPHDAEPACGDAGGAAAGERRCWAGSEPMHLLVDSTGLKLCGKGEWLLEKHGTATRRSWRALHLGVDAGTGRIVASTLTRKDVDDASQAGPLLDQVAGAVASFTGDGAYDRDRVYAGVAERHPDAAVVVPPRASAVPSDTAETAPTQRDGHLQRIAERGRMAWQNASGYNRRARVEATMSRWKQVIGDELRAHTDERRATEVAVAVHALNRMLDLGRPSYVRVA